MTLDFKSVTPIAYEHIAYDMVWPHLSASEATRASKQLQIKFKISELNYLDYLCSCVF